MGPVTEVHPRHWEGVDMVCVSSRVTQNGRKSRYTTFDECRLETSKRTVSSVRTGHVSRSTFPGLQSSEVGYYLPFNVCHRIRRRHPIETLHTTWRRISRVPLIRGQWVSSLKELRQGVYPWKEGQCGGVRGRLWKTLTKDLLGELEKKKKKKNCTS